MFLVGSLQSALLCGPLFARQGAVLRLPRRRPTLNLPLAIAPRLSTASKLIDSTTNDINTRNRLSGAGLFKMPFCPNSTLFISPKIYFTFNYFTGADPARGPTPTSTARLRYALSDVKQMLTTLLLYSS